MAEYIEREAAKNAFPRAEADAFENCRYCTCLDSEQIGEILDNVPTADVVPVRHGRWISEPGHIPHCSECGRYSDDADTGEAICCPFCGARMDGDENG